MVFACIRSLVFPRACIGCDLDDVLLCSACATASGGAIRDRLAGLELLACTTYEGPVRAAILEFKTGRRAFAADLAALCVPFVDGGMTLVPIPTTRRRRAERGFDQTTVLARRLSRVSGCGVASLLTQRPGPAQRGRNRAERLAASGRFRLRRHATAASGAEIILFDDVCTTGTTLVDAAVTLEAGGFAVAGALVIARARPELPGSP